METGWGEGLEEVLAIKTLFTTTANSMKAKVEEDFRWTVVIINNLIEITSYREKSDAAVDAKKADLTEETTYLEMKTAVEDVAKTIIDDSCASATEPCIDKDYIMETMSIRLNLQGLY